ncbi:unnamed protein product [Arctia plantaginis]|uniref:Uncharacterized protein n=1 Tax=Arctia plantaginis TaxID=874455 RepID=A0A8S1BPB5_ARCPL|nr:unnamed protein product [Arctia plantaginis]
MNERKILFFILAVIVYCMYSVHMWFIKQNIEENVRWCPKIDRTQIVSEFVSNIENLKKDRRLHQSTKSLPGNQDLSKDNQWPNFLVCLTTEKDFQARVQCQWFVVSSFPALPLNPKVQAMMLGHRHQSVDSDDESDGKGRRVRLIRRF